MKLRNKLALTASLILASCAAWGHSGHEAFGDVLHIEYLVAAGASFFVVLWAVMRLR